MQEIINQVLEVEESAKRIVQQAHEQAAAIKAAAETELSEKIKNSHLQAQQFIRNETARVKEEAQREYQEIIGRVKKENTDFLDQHNKSFIAVVKKITELLMTPEYKRE